MNLKLKKNSSFYCEIFDNGYNSRRSPANILKEANSRKDLKESEKDHFYLGNLCFVKRFDPGNLASFYYTMKPTSLVFRTKTKFTAQRCDFWVRFGVARRFDCCDFLITYFQILIWLLKKIFKYAFYNSCFIKL